MITLTVNNESVTVADGTTVAVAVIAAGADKFRRSVSGEPRGPLCGMGVCFECRVKIDGVRLQRSCNIAVRNGMEVWIDE